MFIFKWMVISGVLIIIGWNVGHAILGGLLVAFVDSIIESKEIVVVKSE